MQIELKPKQPKTLQKSVRIPVQILDELEKKADPLGLSVPAVIVQILESWYELSTKEHSVGRAKK